MQQILMYMKDHELLGLSTGQILGKRLWKFLKNDNLILDVEKYP
jgi:hypothetical protein